MTRKEALLDAYQKGYRIRNNIIYNPEGKILSGCLDGKGYTQFKHNKTTSVHVHRLVAYQKYGDAMFDEGIEVRHLDRNKRNNLGENIAMGTSKDNSQDIPPEVRKRAANIASSFRKKYNNEAVRAFYYKCKSYKKTMEMFGIPSSGSLHYIINTSKK